VNEALLLWVNQGWASPGLDFFFELLSSRRGFALPLAVVLLLVFLWRWRTTGLKLWLMLLLMAGMGDFLGNQLKLVFAQQRPCYTLAAEVRQLHYPPGQPCGANKTGMPSNHALNGFAVAAFLSLVLRRLAWGASLFALALLVALSRVYLAKHYPSQVAVGAVFGTLWGLICAWLGLKCFPFMQRLRDRRAAETTDHDRN